MRAHAPDHLFVMAPDGLKLHVQVWGDPKTPNRPVVCLPGLARTTEDFTVLAGRLASDPVRPRYVIAMDYRGRGLSDYDTNIANYSLPVELSDLLTVLAHVGVRPAVFVGTSRGGILTMMLAATDPAMIAGAVLNDIGPVIEPAGLARIKSYVGQLPRPQKFKDAAALLQGIFERQFPRLSDDDWMAFARRTFREERGGLEPKYDVKLAQILQSINLDQPLPSLWKEFDALAGAPVMVIRGANSDLLSTETVAAMRMRRPDLVFREVPDQGHAPLLADCETLAAVAKFLAKCDALKSN